MVDRMGAIINEAGGESYINFNSDDLIKIPTSFEKCHNNNYNHYVPSCQKLYLHPYSYIRAEAPSGETKEYKYEDFVDVTNGTNTNNPIALRAAVYLNGTAIPTLIPRRYKVVRGYTNTDIRIAYGNVANATINPQIACEYNINERIEIKDIPPVSYVTDNWLTHLSSG